MEGHPTPDTVLAWRLGTLPDVVREEVATHAAGCEPCRLLAGGSDGAAPVGADLRERILAETRVAFRRRARVRPVLRVAAIAAGILVVGLTASYLRLVPSSPCPVLQGSFSLVTGGSPRALLAGETLEVSEAGTLALSDGTSVACAGGTVLELLAPPVGERLCLCVRAGDVTLDVPPGLGRVQVRTPHGAVRVLGTRFRVRVRSSPRWGTEPGSGGLTIVEVSRGRVDLGTGPDRVELRTGQRGYALGGCPVRRRTPVPASGRWAGNLAEALDSMFLGEAVPVQAQILLAEMEHQGEPGVEAIRSRIIDHPLPARQRARWIAALRWLASSGVYAEAWSAIRDDLEMGTEGR